jgi:hypothetical protein
MNYSQKKRLEMENLNDLLFVLVIAITLDDIGKMCAERIKNKFDVVILIDGLEGTGKSTLAQGLGRAIVKYTRLINSKVNFDMERDTVFYDGDKFFELWHFPGVGFVIIGDEAIAILFNRDSMHPDSKKFVEEFAEGRVYGKVIILLLPDRLNVDTYIRDHRATYWFYLSRRGYADFHVARKRKWRKPGEPGLFWDSQDGVRFPAMPPKTDKRYDGFKRVAKEEYNKKRGYLDVIEPCNKCGNDVHWKKMGKRYELYELDWQPHAPFCKKR